MSDFFLFNQKLFDQWNSLTLANNFLFTKIMQDKEICCHTLELLLGIKIKSLEYSASEVFFKDSPQSRGIRLDVCTTDGDHVYDIEIQTTNNKNLLKRARYYSSVIDVDTLEPAMDFTELKENIIIFICLNDPFQKGLPLYTFKRKCIESPDLPDDKTCQLFYNLERSQLLQSKELKNFFAFIKTNKATDSFTQNLYKKIATAKQNADYRRQYMTLQMELNYQFNEGKRQGVEAGIAQGVAKGMATTKLADAIIAVRDLGNSIEKVAEKFGLSVEEIKKHL